MLTGSKTSALTNANDSRLQQAPLLEALTKFCGG